MSLVRQTVSGHVLEVAIDRPEARNAINGEVARAIESAIDRLEADGDLWVGVLSGRGPVFCAGADLKVVADGGMDSLVTERGGFAGLVERERTKPLIAAVDGPAVAGGCEILLACDLIVASQAASFGLPEVKRSLVAGAGGLFRLPRALPRSVAMELVLTGDSLTAERAFHLGFVNHLTEPGEALPTALDLAQRICANAPVAVRLSRRAVLAGVDVDDATAWAATRAAMAEVQLTADFHEGPRAFLEKRAPVWTGR